MRTSCLLLSFLAILGSSVSVADPSPEDAMRDKCRSVLAAWQGRIEKEGFSSLISPPFVLVGDSSPARLARYRDGTILSAATALKAMYFKAEPTSPILIFLFESEEPYKRLSKQWFGDNDPPHFGYFRHDNIMLMNVGTGTGTLVHEMVHALMKPDFPQVPDWFNEGFASLYEQSSLGPNMIRGHENWRLPALQKTIRAGKLRPLSELIADGHFYNEDNRGINYAQARYVMMYLQEKGLLTTYYAKFRDNAKNDPTGVETLKQVIAPQKLEDFDNAVRTWVLTLKFP